MVSHGIDMHRHRRRLCLGVVAVGLAIGLAGCEDALEATVGPPKGAKPTILVTPPAPPPVQVSMDTSFISDADLSPHHVNSAILAPTLAPDPNETTDPGAPAIPAPGPQHPIASAPLSTDTAQLAALGAAANRETGPSGMRFVLLVLAPPAADAKSMDTGNVTSRQAANAALKALADAGIANDRVDVSLATSANVGTGEIRLYRR
jgi:hypothetical protein